MPQRLLVAWILALGCARVPLLARNQAPNQSHGEYIRADIEHGFRLYSSHCVTCHGPNGDSVPGIDFHSGRFKRAVSDDDLTRIITNGIPGTPMPAQRFGVFEVRALVAYLRSMRDFDPTPVAIGDASRGRDVIEGKGACLTCHLIRGTGSRTGPDLSAIGGLRSAHSLEQSVLDPNGALPPSNRSIRALTADGTQIAGRRLNEDTYSVQLITEDGRLVSLTKSDLREYTILKTARMPSYRDRLSAAEVADIVAYLLSLTF
jgi:putative heme-binding domain-containing protein